MNRPHSCAEILKMSKDKASNLGDQANFQLITSFGICQKTLRQRLKAIQVY
jgi:hypothetical protein